MRALSLFAGLLVCAGLAAAPAAAQVPPDFTVKPEPATAVLQPFPKDKFIPAKTRTPVPYEAWRQRMLFKMTVGGREVTALFDTGASSFIDLKLARTLGLTLEPDLRGFDTLNGGSLAAWRSNDVSLIFPAQFRVDATQFRVADLSLTSEGLGRDIGFIFGSDMLRTLVIAVDPATRTFKFGPSGGLPGAPGADELPVKGTMPVITVSAGGKDLSVMLDTGADREICLTPTAWRSLYPEITGVRASASKDAMGVVREARQGRLKALTLGAARLQDVDLCEQTLPNSPLDGIVGYALLSRYEFTLDIGAGKLWLTPAKPSAAPAQPLNLKRTP